MSDYERPDRGWVCGHACNGQPCAQGPDARGHCNTTAECAPHKRGDRWQCTRPAARGGPCAGPHGACAHALPACQPVRSLRARRTRFVAWCGAAAGALSLLGISGPWWRDVASPGPLTSAHAKLQSECSACHGDGSNAALAWISAPRVSTQAAASACLKCHAELGARALSPHGVDPAQLAAKTAALSGTATAPVVRNEMACATCHREHQGARWNLAVLRDTDCQACHAQRFQGFAQDHAEFKNYPATRRQRIVFDHAGHLKHIKEEGGAAALALLATNAGAETLVCTACHRAEQTGHMLPINGFAPTCTSCHHHAQQIRTAAGEGIPFLRVPGVDLSSLEKRGFPIGAWPREAEGPGWDGPITPFMRLLLSSDAETMRALDTLDAAASRNVYLFDLYDATPSDLRAAQRVAWALKDLWLDLSVDKQQALQQRLLPLAIEPALLQALLPALSGELPVDQPRADLQELYANVAELQRRWFPTLTDDLARHRAGERVGTLRASAKTEAAPAPTAPAAAVNLDDLLGDSTPAPTPESEPAKPAAVNLDDLLGGDTPPPPPAAPPADPKQEQELAAAMKRAAEAEGRYERISGALGQAPRWSLRELDFSIRYRPVGHADPFLKAWLDVTAAAAAPSTGSALFTQLADTKSGPGFCTRCHSVDADTSGLLHVQWRGDRPEARRGSLTWFDHAPHLRVTTGDCSRCHRPSDAPRGAFMASFIDVSTPKTDPLVIEGHFQNVTRALCAECHHDRGAPSDCLTCHRYHARNVALVR